ncbi:MAG: glycine--tRNA ligase subunit beta [Geminicoccaceae bacterium]|nr:glycine--tRNA ligase subunit beta [Geminicoccaceae bacterium]
MAELLLELFSEEIPARMQEAAAIRLREGVVDLLDAAKVTSGAGRVFHTPRRLTLQLADVQAEQEDETVERRGPRVDAPEKAREGFLKSLGTENYELGEIDDKKGRFLVARFLRRGRATRDLLADELPALLGRFEWPKSMRWGDGEARWVRPLQGILCIFDGDVVPFAFAGLQSGASTRGHRFMAPEPFTVSDFSGYEAALRQAGVVLDPAERRARIEEWAGRLAAGEGLRLRADERLLDELAGLVEWPVPLLGRIDDDFMSLPPEVLVTSMREHQKYLALEHADGRLASHFVAVANIETTDGGAAITAGNERVLRARLWDARYFWDTDRKTRLEDRLPALETMVFHDKLGTMRERAERLEKLARRLAPECGADADAAALAGRLAKADLVTGMIGEFPELQGIMGGHYARAEGLSEAVAEAIAEHYRFVGTPLTGPAARATNLADKLDMLAGFFAAGIRPSGSKDPFALRRAASGAAWVIRAHALRLPLREALVAALGGYPQEILAKTATKAVLADELLAFVKHRGSTAQVIATALEWQNRDRGHPFNIPSIFHCVMASADDDLVRLDALRDALLEFLATEDGLSLVAAYRRASNILRIEAEKDGIECYPSDPDEASLQEAAERRLWSEARSISAALNDAMAGEDFTAAMRLLARLRPVIDAFFDQVMVNAEDPALRENRLRLLAVFRARANRIADFALIED